MHAGVHSRNLARPYAVFTTAMHVDVLKQWRGNALEANVSRSAKQFVIPLILVEKTADL